MGLLAKDIIFSVLVPGTVAVVIPMALQGARPPRFGVRCLPGLILIAMGASVYL
jgi:hypothetical protein